MELQVRKATWLELFYDLVFVVAIAKAVHTLGHAHEGHIPIDLYGKYILIMVPLWWAWTGHTLFSNRFDTDDTLQRLMTLAQMACAASMALFISADFEPNYRGFLLSYVALRGLLVLMYWRASVTSKIGAILARYLAHAFTFGLLISLSSLFFDTPWNYVVMYAGIFVDILMPLVLRGHLVRFPVQSHHLPERFGLLTIILLGESVASLVSTLVGVPLTTETQIAAFAGFIWIAAIWWIYFENLEHRIYGRALGTGQTVIYLHLVIYIALGGIANAIRFAVDPALTLSDYKWLAGASTIVFVIALEWLHLTYHQKIERGAVLRHGAALLSFVIGAIWISPSSLVIVILIAAIFAAYAVVDAKRRHMSPPSRSTLAGVQDSSD